MKPVSSMSLVVMLSLPHVAGRIAARVTTDTTRVRINDCERRMQFSCPRG